MKYSFLFQEFLLDKKTLLVSIVTSYVVFPRYLYIFQLIMKVDCLNLDANKFENCTLPGLKKFINSIVWH